MILLSEATCDTASKTFTVTQTARLPGVSVKVREVIKVLDATITSPKNRDTGEAKTMEMSYAPKEVSIFTGVTGKAGSVDSEPVRHL